MLFSGLFPWLENKQKSKADYTNEEMPTESASEESDAKLDEESTEENK